MRRDMGLLVEKADVVGRIGVSEDPVWKARIDWKGSVVQREHCSL